MRELNLEEVDEVSGGSTLGFLAKDLKSLFGALGLFSAGTAVTHDIYQGLAFTAMASGSEIGIVLGSLLFPTAIADSTLAGPSVIGQPGGPGIVLGPPGLTMPPSGHLPGLP